MPSLDRRITVQISSPAYNQYGEQDGVTTRDVGVWATRLDASTIDAATRGGMVDNATRTYRVRWRDDFAAAATSALSVVEGGTVLSVHNVIEEGGPRAERRRFLRLESVGETP